MKKILIALVAIFALAPVAFADLSADQSSAIARPPRPGPHGPPHGGPHGPPRPFPPRPYPPPYPPNTGYRTDYIRCESINFGYNQCPIYFNGVQSVFLARQESSAACISGSTFGTNGYSIWVNNGCRGTFAVNHY